MVDGDVDNNDDDKDDVDYLKRGLLVSLLNPRHRVHRHMPRIAHSSTCLVWMFILFVIFKKAKCLLNIFIVIHVTMIFIYLCHLVILIDFNKITVINIIITMIFVMIILITNIFVISIFVTIIYVR